MFASALLAGTGALIGAGVGLARGEGSARNRFESVVMGAAAGAGVGMGVRAGIGAARSGIGAVGSAYQGMSQDMAAKGIAGSLGMDTSLLRGGPIWRGADLGIRAGEAGMKGVRGIGKVTGPIARFAMRNPYTALGMGVGGAALWAGSDWSKNLKGSTSAGMNTMATNRYDASGSQVGSATAAATLDVQLTETNTNLMNYAPGKFGKIYKGYHAFEASTEGLTQGLHRGRHR